LQNLLSYVPPESIGSQIKRFGNDLGYYADSNSAVPAFDINDENFKSVTSRLFELNNEKGSLLHQIGDTGSNAQSIKEEYLKIDNLLKESDEKIGKFEGQVLNWRKEVNKLEKDIQRISQQSGVNAKLDQELMYVRALYHKAQKDYSEGSKEILAKMRETLQEVFSSMYHGHRLITLGDDYRITDSSHLDDSKGLSTVKNFAFITTLLKVARDRMDGENGLGAEPYPLVMDAVFSNTDKTHIRNISHELPAMAEQAILALMEKDWEVAKPTLSEFVGKIYLIDKKGEDETYIREVTVDDA
jgi:DNA sulfur modification protein DndD